MIKLNNFIKKEYEKRWHCREGNASKLFMTLIGITQQNGIFSVAEQTPSPGGKVLVPWNDTEQYPMV